jgi:capsular polysaccharide biosynthesis protein
MMTQALPHLLLASRLADRQKQLIVGGPHEGGHEFARACLKLLLPNHEIVELLVGEKILVNRLDVCSPLTNNILLPAGIKLLRQSVLDAFDISVMRRPSPNVVFLRRIDSERNRRRLLNEEEVVAVLRSKWPNLTVVSPGMLSFQEQVRSCMEADIVIGLHGAQLTNLLWAKRGATVLEFIPDTMPTPTVFNALAGVLGMKYLSVPATSSHPIAWANADQEIEPSELQSAIRVL